LFCYINNQIMETEFFFTKIEAEILQKDLPKRKGKN
jgi:hypothetical protein